MGIPNSIPKIDTEVDTTGSNSTSNHNSNRDSVVTQISIAGDSVILGLVIIVAIVCGILWYLHRTNFHLLHSRLNNLAQLAGFGQDHITAGHTEIPLSVITVDKK